MLLNLAAWTTIAVGFSMQLLTRRLRRDIMVVLGASMGMAGASCMVASFLVAHEGAAIGLQSGALFLLVGSIAFYGVALVRNRQHRG